jgi:ribose transport system permease protein
MTIWNYLKRHGQPFIGLLLIVILGAVTSPPASDGSNVFLSPGNLSDVLMQQSEIGIIALGMTFVIIGAGIDLSVGSILAFAACLAAFFMTTGKFGRFVWMENVTGTLPIVLGIGAALLGGALAGAFNGLVITRIKLQPFVMTLAMMIGLRGLTKYMTGNVNTDLAFNTVDKATGQVTHVPSGDFAALFSDKLFAVSLWIGLAILAHLLLRQTVFGRYLRAIGENEKAAVYTGLPVRNVRLLTYIGIGVLTALAGLIHAARSHQGNPNDGSGYELDAIAAVVIGGTALAGGRGSIVGTVIGTLVLGLLNNVLGLHNIDSNLEMIVKALIIIVAVWLQRRTHAGAS